MISFCSSILMDHLLKAGYICVRPNIISGQYSVVSFAHLRFVIPLVEKKLQ